VCETEQCQQGRQRRVADQLSNTVPYVQVRGGNRAGGVKSMLQSLQTNGWMPLEKVIVMPVADTLDFNKPVASRDIRQLDAHHRVAVSNMCKLCSRTKQFLFQSLSIMHE
jgi:hypothetical protein